MHTSRRHERLPGAAALLVGAVMCLGCEQAVLGPTEDATVLNTAPDQTFCEAECLDVHKIDVVGGGDFIARSYLVFDTADGSIDPPIQTVATATLVLGHCLSCALPGAAVQAHRVTESWDCVGAIAPPISWSFQPSFDAAPAASAPCAGDEDIRLDVTSLVQEWVDRPTSNFGLVLTVDEAATFNQEFSFGSVESPEPDLRPELVVNYSG